MEIPLPNNIHIAFDNWTLLKGGVDVQTYQDKLIAALPNHELKFSIAPDRPQSNGMPFATNMAGGADAKLAYDAAEKIWPKVVNTAVLTTSIQPEIVSILGEQIKVGHVTVFKNQNDTWSLELVREIYKVDGDTITFGLGPVGHAMRTVLKNDRVPVTRESATSMGS
jgi:hypothetical protein